MEIIRKSEEHHKRYYTVHCECGTKYRCTVRDGVPMPDYNGLNDGAIRAVDCPCCERSVEIPLEDFKTEEEWKEFDELIKKFAKRRRQAWLDDSAYPELLYNTTKRRREEQEKKYPSHDNPQREANIALAWVAALPLVVGVGGLILRWYIGDR